MREHVQLDCTFTLLKSKNRFLIFPYVIRIKRPTNSKSKKCHVINAGFLSLVSMLALFEFNPLESQKIQVFLARCQEALP